MNTKSLLIVLVYFSIAIAYGPVFILESGEELEVYYNDKIDNEALEEYIQDKPENIVRILYINEDNSTVSIISSFVKYFGSRIIFPHYIDVLNTSESVVVNNLTELSLVPVEGKKVVLEFLVGSLHEPINKEKIEESRNGVPMTPSVLFALLTIFTLAYSFYAAVKCVDSVQTPTAYTNKALPVGKEY